MVFATQLKKGNYQLDTLMVRMGSLRIYLNHILIQMIFKASKAPCSKEYIHTSLQLPIQTNFMKDGKDPIQIFHVHIHFNPAYIIAFTFTPTHFGSVNCSHICLSPFK